MAHSCIDKLLALINNSGKQRAENKNLKRELRTLQKIYQHKNLQKSLARLVALLPIANQFQQTIALDLKENYGHIIVHLTNVYKDF